MDTATTAELEALDDRRLARYQRTTYRTFVIAGIGFLVPALAALVHGLGDGTMPVALAPPALAGTGLLLWGYMRLVRTGLEGGAGTRDIVWTGLVTFALILLAAYNPLWAVTGMFWVSAVALSPMSARRLLAYCAGTAAVTIVVVGLAFHVDEPGRPTDWLGILGGFAAVFGGGALAAFVNRYQRGMWDLHLEAHHAREALARMAVTEERLRFSRDLHDLLGHSLSLIAVKSELAIRMAENDPARARAEMADVRRAAREALREVRAAVRGYRAVELDAELAGVRAVLEAAGVRCEIGAVPADLPPEARSVLAWAIREGATNVIKHSEARRCSISLTVYGESVVLEMNNDGVRAAGAEPGSGLAGLTERLAVVGGALSAGRHGRDGFLLRAVVPLSGAAPDAEPVRSTA
ncbi:sensor histidine kinase [Actinomadura kijaniata]|uniref:sensor histidine kinase n=1 Tax=Actinomadura kijaniata TaxID=46161 RepID=UPI000AE57049|nr:histidine kinase [Actinomadura kijaniata]